MPDYVNVKVRREFADAVETLIADGSLGYGSISEFVNAAAREKLQSLRSLASPRPSPPLAPVQPDGPPPAASTAPPATPAPSASHPLDDRAVAAASGVDGPRAVPAPRPSVVAEEIPSSTSGPVGGGPDPTFSTPRSGGHGARGEPATASMSAPETPGPVEDNEAPEAADVRVERPVDPAARDGAPVARSTATCGKCGATYALEDREAHWKACGPIDSVRRHKPAGSVKPLDAEAPPAPKVVDVGKVERFVREFAESPRLPGDQKKAYLIAAVHRNIEVQGCPPVDDATAAEFLSRIANHVPAVRRALEGGS